MSNFIKEKKHFYKFYYNFLHFSEKNFFNLLSETKKFYYRNRKIK